MSKSNNTPNDAKIASAALHLAGTKGWAKVSLEGVAKATRVPLATLAKRFTNASALIPLIAAEIDRDAFKTVGKTAGTPHDILFDLLMARFDNLQKHRKAILSMSEVARHDRLLTCALARATLEGVYRVIAAARLSKPSRPVLAIGLSTIYGWAFLAWRRDQSRDLAPTMAALDRALRLATRILAFLEQKA